VVEGAAPVMKRTTSVRMVLISIPMSHVMPLALKIWMKKKSLSREAGPL
jgi:hypothetical protein